MRDVTWFLTNWHWFAGVLALAVILVIVGAVLALRADEGDPSEVARFDAYLDDVESEPWREQDCPDDAPDGTCWYCSATRREPHREWCPTQREPDDLLAPAPDRTWDGGEQLHYMDTWLGRPGDGSEHTALRIRREGEAMLARVEAARRELAAECGIRYVPMELVAA